MGCERRPSAAWFRGGSQALPSGTAEATHRSAVASTSSTLSTFISLFLPCSWFPRAALGVPFPAPRPLLPPPSARHSAHLFPSRPQPSQPFPALFSPLSTVDFIRPRSAAVCADAARATRPLRRPPRPLPRDGSQNQAMLCCPFCLLRSRLSSALFPPPSFFPSPFRCFVDVPLFPMRISDRPSHGVRGVTEAARMCVCVRARRRRFRATRGVETKGKEERVRKEGRARRSGPDGRVEPAGGGEGGGEEEGREQSRACVGRWREGRGPREAERRTAGLGSGKKAGFGESKRRTSEAQQNGNVEGGGGRGAGSAGRQGWWARVQGRRARTRPSQRTSKAEKPSRRTKKGWKRWRERRGRLGHGCGVEKKRGERASASGRADGREGGASAVRKAERHGRNRRGEVGSSAGAEGRGRGEKGKGREREAR